MKEGADGDLGQQAMMEADFGACESARQDAGPLMSNPGRVASALAGFALATCGDAKKAELLAADLNKKYPLETAAQKVDIPQIRARVDLQKGDGAKAVDELRPAGPYEFGIISFGIPVYLRGLAYLKMKQGSLAAAEFQKIVDHKGAMQVSPYLSLARLGLGRAYSLSGDTAKARTAYQDFFALWKDADPDVPILKDAKAEYDKIK
jgi:tetratricopeptide (TPR) repeat protein